jgi:N6-adenosine-specific RNA methylase IME4
MTANEAEEYTQALAQSVSGGYRTLLLGVRLGVPKALGLTVEQWANGRLGGYVKLSIAERTAASVDLVKNEHLTTREAAAVLGVGRSTVARDIAGPNGTAPSVEPPPITLFSRESPTAADPDGTSAEPLDVLSTIAATEAVRKEAADQATRTSRRSRREAVAAANRQRVELPEAKYRVLYADPPWRYNDKADAGSVQSGGAEQHYPSMSIADLCALPVPALCEANAVLFLWTTAPLLAESFAVVDAWGFTYKTCFIWDKHAHNMGHYNSVRHECLLVCVRGSCLPDVPKLFDSVQKTGRTEHSEKPGVFRIIIDTLYPHGKRIELFARETVEGWDAWGNEVERAS